MDKIIQAFYQAADPALAAPMAAYMKHRFPFLGIKTPKRRELSREFIKQLAKRPPDLPLIHHLYHLPEREFQYLACDCLLRLQKKLTDQDLPFLKDLVLTKPWWDTVDNFDGIIGALTLRHPHLKDTMLRWSQHPDFWLRRIAIDHQLSFHEQTDTDLLSAILKNNLNQTEFFINKAIGWSLREYSKTNPDWVRAFLDAHRPGLSPLSIREASKYL